MLSDRRPERRILPHTPPPWVPNHATFTITIVCKPRGENHLCHTPIADQIFSSAEYYRTSGAWYPELILLMPDHIHLLAAFTWKPGEGMPKLIARWKRWLSAKAGLRFQDGFFDHRIRSEKDHIGSFHYIMHNPVRAGLATEPESWPWSWRPTEPDEGREVSPRPPAADAPQL